MATIAKEKKDVIIVGGGTAGICAALAASRNGMKTCLIERYGYLGGEIVTGLAFLTFHDSRGNQVIGGIPQEIVDRLMALDANTGHALVRDGHIYSVSYSEPEMFKYVTMEMLLEAGVELLFHSLVVDAMVKGNRVCGVIVENKSGRQIYPAKVVIDCSGDADVAAAAGVPFEKGDPKTGRTQAMTLMFKMGNVRLEEIPKFLKDGITYGRKPGRQGEEFIRAQGSLAPWEKLVEREGLFPDRSHLIAINSIHEGEVNINTTRIVGLDGTSAEDLTKAEIEGRRQVMKVVKFLKKYVPGFENSYLISTAAHVGVRETRRIIGEYVLTEDDILSGKRFPDTIAQGSYPIDMHDPDGRGIFFEFIKNGGSYDIPYRCLVPQKIDNLIIAGRCISTTHRASASTRVTAIGAATGQAAGTAAALAVKSAIVPRKVDVSLLQSTLVEQGVILREREL